MEGLAKMEKLIKDQNGKMENNGNVNGIERGKIEMRKMTKGLMEIAISALLLN